MPTHVCPHWNCDPAHKINIIGPAVQYHHSCPTFHDTQIQLQPLHKLKLDPYRFHSQYNSGILKIQQVLNALLEPQNIYSSLLF